MSIISILKSYSSQEWQILSLYTFLYRAYYNTQNERTIMFQNIGTVHTVPCRQGTIENTVRY